MKRDCVNSTRAESNKGCKHKALQVDGDYMETSACRGIQILFMRKYNMNLKQEIYVIIQSKSFCLLDFSLRIGKLKYIKQ